MTTSTTLDIRGLQAAPPYLEDEGNEMCWLRGDFAQTAAEANAVIARLWSLEDEDAKALVVGLVAMEPDTEDTFNERWKLCAPDKAQAHYWQAGWA